MAKLAEPIRNAIDQMGEEGVELELLDADAFERNRGAYLHRVYQKHETDEKGITKWAGQFFGKRRKKIIGDQFKGGGLWIEVAASRLSGSEVAQDSRFGVFDRMDDGTETLGGSSP